MYDDMTYINAQNENFCATVSVLTTGFKKIIVCHYSSMVDIADILNCHQNTRRICENRGCTIFLEKTRTGKFVTNSLIFKSLAFSCLTQPFML